MPSPALPLVVDTKADWIHAVGDSLVQWLGNVPPQGLFSPLYNDIWSEQARRAAPVGGYRATKSMKYAAPSLMPCTQDGKSGTGIHDLFVNVQTRVINPLLAGGVGRTGQPILIHYNSVNDGGPMTIGPYTTNGGPAYFDAILAAVPNVVILSLPILFGGTLGGGEAWDTVNHTWTADRTLLNSSNAFYQNYAASRGFYFYDWCGGSPSDPHTLLNLLSVYNPAGLLSGVITQDGTHPSAFPNPGGSVDPTLYNGERLIIDMLKASSALDIRY